VRTGPSPIPAGGKTNIAGDRIPQGNEFELCKDFTAPPPAGTTVTFVVRVNQDSMGFGAPFNVTLNPGACQIIWNDVGIGRDIVEVTEQVPAGYQTPTWQKIVLEGGGGITTTNGTGATESGPVAHDDVGTTLIFTNTADPEVEPGTGRMTGGGQVLVAGVRISKGLTIHCDLLLSNNLEVNWNGNKFHMTEHIDTVACTDDPAIIQAPPAAPLDTLIGVGTGKYNGAEGYTVEFTFIDYGEPGSLDRVALKIYPTGNPGAAVLDFPVTIVSNGNIQAHFDQPHK
jgi:hypothetical protein